MINRATAAEVLQFIQSTGKKVITFIGYSGSGYEDKKAMLEEAEKILETYDPASFIVNSGATLDGIGAVYELAKSQGYTTMGVVSTQAQKYKVDISPYADHVFYVEDSTWGGFVEEEVQLSPTSSIMVEISDVLVAIGGGEIGRDELMGAQQLGKEIRFFPADMNHQIAREKSQQKGLPIPTDFRGAAAKLFEP